MRLISECSICGKPKVQLSVTPLTPDTNLVVYKCGHVFVEERQVEVSTEVIDITSVDGTKKARPYQIDGVKFVIDSGYNCMIADQMRLGKTPQSLLALKNALTESAIGGKRLPCIILVRSANLFQWKREIETWVDNNITCVWPILTGKEFIPPGFKVYLLSMDLFSKPKVREQLLKLKPRFVIADEAHSFKNDDSNRSQALVDFMHTLNQEEYKEATKCSNCGTEVAREQLPFFMGLNCCKDPYRYPRRCQVLVSSRQCGLILLTGTPIKNRADEYYVSLNLLAPTVFPSKTGFQRNWLMQDEKNKYTRVKPYRLDDFKKTIAPYVIRREKEDVYTDLPIIDRRFTLIAMENEKLKKAYNLVLDAMEELYESKGGASFMEMQENMMLLRRICGLAKVDWISDYVDISLEDSDKSRYCIGMHHKDVREAFLNKLGSHRCLSLSGADNSQQKDWVMRNFETSPQRVLVMNMVAGGIGMDFHYCNNVLIAERMWSSADEEQFEFRFYNPDKSIKIAKTEIEYVLAQGTIDQYFYDMIENKRKIFGETVATHWDLNSGPSEDWRELVERTIGGRL